MKILAEFAKMQYVMGAQKPPKITKMTQDQQSSPTSLIFPPAATEDREKFTIDRHFACLLPRRGPNHSYVSSHQDDYGD